MLIENSGLACRQARFREVKCYCVLLLERCGFFVFFVLFGMKDRISWVP